MKKRKIWLAVILAAMLAVGQGIISAAPAESAETEIPEAAAETVQEETDETEATAETTETSESKKQTNTEKETKIQPAKELLKIGGGGS